MVTSLLRYAKGAARSSWIRGPLRAIGVVAIARKIYDRRVLKRGIHEASFLGTPLSFVVTARREIDRLDAPFNEAEFVERLLASVAPGDVVFDIGANIGIVSLLAAARAGAGRARIHAFEPEPTNFDHLCRNAALNSMQGSVLPHAIALGNAVGTIDLHVEAGGEAGTGTHSIVQTGAGTTTAVSVPLMTGDEFARREGIVPDVMKIDVEGAELDVIDGFQRLLSAGRVRDVLVEVHPGVLASLGRSADDLHATLVRHGFERVWMRERGLERHEHYRRVGTTPPSGPPTR